MIKQLTYIIAVATILFSVGACKKEKTAVPPTFAHFDFVNTGEYYVTQTASTFKIPLGLTAAADGDRTIEITITSPTGAKEGQQFSVNKKSFTIPAGKVTDSIIVSGIYAGLSSGKVDTVIFKISGGSVTAMQTEQQYTLYLQQYCDVDINSFSGLYSAQDYYEGAPDGGPYDIYLTPVGLTGPTSGTITLDGLWLVPTTTTLKLDWADPAKFSTEMTAQPWFIHPAVGQISIKPNGKGSFSSCNNSLRVEYEGTFAGGSFKYTTIITK
ncbi:hypothetical protein [Paraflavitalea sp. CAU 1676]|uniref:hypothetical protein n=1 Tax=Paraflavitalea sp. CAU 1676 TaxID=3032598 RepID=UPI0023DC7489|nr:hypothetical protein [Paraflavitalea sp. CAU 1676]MDF2187138.1 hypothetical protein [Paraflavitalea sp. CAU 1676]